MENRALQEDEVETLQAIYGEDVELLSQGTCICYSVSVSTANATMSIEITYPEGYPTNCPPVYELRGTEWLSSKDIENIVKKFTQIHKDCEGEVVVYQWVEYVREYIATVHAPVEMMEAQQTPSTPHDISLPANQSCNAPQGNSENCSQLTTPPASQEKLIEKNAPVIIHGEPLTDRKSTFQAHLAAITSREEVAMVVAELKTNKKIASATHNIVAFRCMDVGKGGVMVQDCDDDGESAAGGRLLHLLQMMGAMDVVVVVSRWYGGILLHGDRFKHINNVARTLLQDSGIGLQERKGEPVKTTKKERKRTKY